MVDFKRRSHNKLLPGDRCYLICCEDSDGFGMRPRYENLLQLLGEVLLAVSETLFSLSTTEVALSSRKVGVRFLSDGQVLADGG